MAGPAGPGVHSGYMKPCIYVVDDEPDFQTILHSWLAPAYDVVPLRDGDELIGALHVKVPDLVLLDLHLPGANGFDLCRRVRSTPGLTKVPVLFLTASHESRDYARNFKAGGSGFLTKPIGRQQLLSVVDDLLADSRAGILQTVDSGGGD